MEYNKAAVTSTVAVTPTRCEASNREPESIVTLIGKSAEIARSIEETVRVLEPRCFRDVCAQHMERMKRIDAMLNSVKERLGV